MHTFQNNFLKKIQQCKHIEGQLIFPSQPNFFNLFEFSATKNPLNNQYLPHLSSENCEINFIKSTSRRAFQQQQEHPPNSITIVSFHFIYFSLRKWFHNQQLPHVAPKSLEPNQCTPTLIQSLLKTPRVQMKHHGLGDLCMTNKTKQNKTRYLAS